MQTLFNIIWIVLTILEFLSLIATVRIGADMKHNNDKALRYKMIRQTIVTCALGAGAIFVNHI